LAKDLAPRSCLYRFAFKRGIRAKYGGENGAQRARHACKSRKGAVEDKETAFNSLSDDMIYQVTDAVISNNEHFWPETESQ
jgi:hypothetical protein